MASAALLGSSAVLLASSSSSTHIRTGTAFRISSSSSPSTSTRLKRPAIRRVKDIVSIADDATRTVSLLPAPAADGEDEADRRGRVTATTTTTTTDGGLLQLAPLQSFALDPAATQPESLGQAAPLTVLVSSSVQTTYLTLAAPTPALRAYTETRTSSAAAGGAGGSTTTSQEQTILPEEYAHDAIESLHLLSTGELAACHARSASLSIFQRKPSQDGAGPTLDLLYRWQPFSAATKETASHHVSVFDSAPALHLLRGTASDYIHHERVCALVVRVASAALPSKQTNASSKEDVTATRARGSTKTRQAGAGRRKSALEVMDDLAVLPPARGHSAAANTPEMEPAAAVMLQVSLVQTRGNDPAGLDRVRAVGESILVPGFEGHSSGDGPGDAMGAGDVLSCSVHADGRISILSRRASLHTYEFVIGPYGELSLLPIRVFNLRHFNFVPPSTASTNPSTSSKPAAVLALTGSHLLLVGLVAVPSSSPGSSHATNASPRKLRPRIHAAIFDTALEAIVAETDLSPSLLPPHFSLPKPAVDVQTGAELTGLGEVGFSISATRASAARATVVLNSTPPVSSIGANGAHARPTARFVAALVLPLVVPTRSYVQHALGKAEMTARWMSGVPASASTLPVTEAETSEGKRYRRKRVDKGGGAEPGEGEADGDAVGPNGALSKEGGAASALSFAQLTVRGDWGGVVRLMRTRPDADEGELVRALVGALVHEYQHGHDEGSGPLRKVLRALVALPLSRPLVRAALKRHLRLPSLRGGVNGATSGGAGSASGSDEVVEGVVRLVNVLCEWVEAWAAEPLRQSGWAAPDKHNKSSKVETSKDLPGLDDVITLLTDLLDTFFPNLIAATAPSPTSSTPSPGSQAARTQAALTRLQASLAIHARQAGALGMLNAPLGGFAVVEGERERARRALNAATASEAVAGSTSSSTKASHPALRGWSDTWTGYNPAKAAQEKKILKLAKKKAKKGGGLKSTASEGLVNPARASTGGGGSGAGAAALLLRDGTGQTKRRMMQQASMLVGDYAVEVLEF